ncbi:Cytochrome P450 [Cordyceps javanica]|uniref:Cytochrome P450 n=1 Tax=Cordyceps javanica TaxID=43265 RepID=A0A545UUR3_9HYPO|nr:Cytochrome P450 [Cordyceps javanica]TQW05431.1 Cytochrome P450 [Cordyceps javanica]
MSAMLDNTLQSDDLVIHEEMGCPGTWLQNILGEYFVTTADPDNIKAMLATQFHDFELGPLRLDQIGPLIGHGIFTSDGKEWQQQRAMLRPQFTRSQISNLALLETHVQNLFRHFDDAHHQPGSWTSEVDLAPLFFNLTLDAATEFLFGQSVESQTGYQKTTTTQRTDAAEEEKKDGRDGGVSGRDWSSFGRAFDRANATIALRGMMMNFYWLYKPSTFDRDCEEVRQFADYFVRRALMSQGRGDSDSAADDSAAAADDDDGSSSSSSSSPQPPEAYVFLRELAKTTRDPDALRSQLLNILLAGRDTTAGLLGWTFFLLARHPAHYSRLHRVVVEAFGPYSPGGDDDARRRITFESLKACRPVQHLLSEVLRLHPVVPENGRRAVRDTTLPRGGGPDGQSPVFVRGGSHVIYSVNVMHHRKDLWGDDAHAFRPGRWADRRGGHNHGGGGGGWEYLPFNGGPRVCLGQQYALTEAAYVVVRTLQKYGSIENLDPDPVTRHRYTLTTAPVKVAVRLCRAG